ncbi:MAG: ATPase domain-containing protein, partial [Oscillospiraceae bacterium]
MAKVKKFFVCNQCGYETSKWLGKCPECESWNTFSEEIVTEAPSKYNKAATNIFDSAAVKSLKDINSSEEMRYVTDIGELDRVLGGGMVPGEIVLISGDPGIGKSTLLLQMCNSVKKDMKILYATGEESSRQIKLRALRLGVEGENLFIYAGTNLMSIIGIIEEQKPDLVVVDSIQTMMISEISSSAGSITQIRECTQQLIKTGKTNEIPIFLVG